MVITSNRFVTNPLVSVIIPSFNRSKTVAKTIESILQQRCNFDYEVIIGDDCSTDNVREILQMYHKKFPEFIKLVFHDQNIGLGANWAHCVKICNGKYIAGCDNDDYWHNSEKLNLQVQFLEENLDYGMVHTNFRELNGKTGKIIEKVIHHETYSEPMIHAIFYGRFKCCNSSVMYRRSIIDKHVNLNDYIDYHFPLQDWNTWISISNFTKFHCLPVSTTTVRIGTESITRPKDLNILKQRFVNEKIMSKYMTKIYNTL